MPNNTQQQIDQLRSELEALKMEFYRGNFTGNQDFSKSVRFNSKVKLPTLSSAPTTCEQGELYVNSGTGKLYVCSAANTWSLVGGQT